MSRRAHLQGGQNAEALLRCHSCSRSPRRIAQLDFASLKGECVKIAVMLGCIYSLPHATQWSVPTSISGGLCTAQSLLKARGRDHKGVRTKRDLCPL